MKVAIIVFAMAITAKMAKALRCYECENAISKSECQAKGSLRTCHKNEESCQNEVRIQGTGRGYKVRITKGCKQSKACQNNILQNSGLAWWKVQCTNELLRGFQGESTCHCCCDSNGCNSGFVYCLGSRSGLENAKQPRQVQDSYLRQNNYRNQCDRVTSLVNGQVSCTDGDNNNSVCTSSCNFGYQLQGEQCYPGHPRWNGQRCHSRCVSGVRRQYERKGAWRPALPRCVALNRRPN